VVNGNLQTSQRAPVGDSYTRQCEERRKESLVNIDKEQIVQFLRDKGQDQQADEAARKLPDPVDTDQHADLLARHGVDLNELTERFGGALGDYL
jgi:hypothetical protein